MRYLAILVASLVGLNALAQAHPLKIDLKGIRDLAPKGRMQDKEYNPNQRVVDQLIATGPSSLEYLVSKLEDETLVGHHVLDYWQNIRVGDVAFLALCDFTTTSDWQHYTVEPGLWSLVPQSEVQSAWQAWDDFVKKVGRAEIRRRVQKVLKLESRKYTWDRNESCFRPTH